MSTGSRQDKKANLHDVSQKEKEQHSSKNLLHKRAPSSSSHTRSYNHRQESTQPRLTSTGTTHSTKKSGGISLPSGSRHTIHQPEIHRNSVKSNTLPDNANAGQVNVSGSSNNPNSNSHAPNSNSNLSSHGSRKSSQGLIQRQSPSPASTHGGRQSVPHVDILKFPTLVRGVIRAFPKKHPHSNEIEGQTLLKTSIIHVVQTKERIGDHVETVGSCFYDITDAGSHRIYLAAERSKFSGGNRPFLISLFNAHEKLVLTMERIGNFSLCCCGSRCCGNDLKISKANGDRIGEVRQRWNWGLQKYDVFDPQGIKLMTIHGPNQRTCCQNYIGNDATFHVFSLDPANQTDEVEVIGLFKVYTAPKTFKMDNFVFSVEFTFDLKPEFKTIILAAGILLDLSFFDVQSEGCCVCYGNFLFVFLIFLAFILILCLFSIFHFLSITNTK